MKKLTFYFLMLTCFSVFAQNEVKNGLNSITVDAVKGQLEFLASDWTEGRAVGTKGEYIASDYIASMFKVYGIKPFGDAEVPRSSGRRSSSMSFSRPAPEKSYFQNIALIEYEPGDEQTFSVITSSPGSEKGLDFAYQTDFSIRPGTVGMNAKAPLVFIGYGYTNTEKGYDDLKKIDLKGKIAIMLSGFPGMRDTSSAGYKKFNSDRYEMFRQERDRLTKLEKAGVVAVIQVSGGSNPTLSWAQNQIYPVKGSYYESDKLLKSYYDGRVSMPEDTLRGSIPMFTVTPRVVNEIFSGTGVNIDQFEKSVAQTLQPVSQILQGKSIAFKTTVKSKVIKARNVVGYIEGEKKDEFIVVGGHYDHLGKWDGWVFNGADDNASGTVGVMTIAKAFMATGKKPEKSVIFAAWTGEEKGLYGSSFFVNDAKKKKMNVVLNLNYDMIARDIERDTLKNKADMSYTKAYPGIEKVTKKHIEDYKINLNLSYRASERPSGGSDHAPFAAAGIPIFYFMAAMHPDYHQPSDELSKINWEKMTNIIKIGFLNTWEFANSNEYLKPEEKK